MRTLFVFAAVVGLIATPVAGQNKSKATRPSRVPKQSATVQQKPAAPATPQQPAVQPPAAPEPVQAEPVEQVHGEAGTPAEVATRYLNHLASDRPHSAIEECVDVAGMAELVFGDDLRTMDAGRVGYVEQMTSVMMKAIVSAVPTEKILAKATRSPYQVKEDGERVRVSFSVTYSSDVAAEALGTERPATPRMIKREIKMVMMRKGERGWRIVELESMVPALKKAYAAAQGETPVEFLEKQVAITLAGKFESEVGEQMSEDARTALIMTQLDTLNNQIELFNAREARYPDLVNKGWKEMIDGGYIKAAPSNPLNGSSAVCLGTERENFGWHWDQRNGLGAWGFDEERGTVTVQPKSAGDLHQEHSAKAQESACKGALGGVRSAVANFYANAAVKGKAVYPTVDQLKKPGVVLEGKMPVNPYNGSAEVAAAKWSRKGPVSGKHGWNYDAGAGRVWANSNNVGENEW